MRVLQVTFQRWTKFREIINKNSEICYSFCKIKVDINGAEDTRNRPWLRQASTVHKGQYSFKTMTNLDFIFNKIQVSKTPTDGYTMQHYKLTCKCQYWQ